MENARSIERREVNAVDRQQDSDFLISDQTFGWNRPVVDTCGMEKHGTQTVF
jgi:hypothetical protein